MNLESAASTILRGKGLVMVRAVWLAVGALAVGLFVAGIPAEYKELRLGCPTESCSSSGGLAPIELSLLENLGLSVDFFAAYGIALEVVFASVYVVVAVLIFWLKSSDRQALFVSSALLIFGTATQPFTLSALVAAHPSWGNLVDGLHFLGSASFSLFLFIFPDGRFTPRWTRWVALVWIAWLMPRYWFPDWPPSNSDDTWLVLLNLVVWLGALGGAIYSQAYRYRHVSNTIQRQQTKWVVFGIAIGLVLFIIVNIAVSSTVPVPTSAGDLTTLMAGAALMNSALLLIPLSIGVAILRHHLFDVDLLINRTLVYLTLTAIVVGTYMFVVGYLSTLFHAGNNLVISILAAGCIAVLFAPLRDRLQRIVNRLIYGERDDPYAVLSHLGQRLEAAFAPETILPTLVETIAQSLKLPYVAITLSRRGKFKVAAEFGHPQEKPHNLPLVYQGESVGQLLFAPRSHGEAFTPAEQRLLADLARQAEVAVYTVRLTSDLQRSRQQLVTTREEERRRLRRDLHDDLGPTLASLAQRLDTARNLIPHDPKKAGALLGDIKEQVKGTIAEIRRLVYALRPPALDELGLVGALREHIAQYDQLSGLNVSLEASPDLPSLPAAVEVAAYYIALEAFTNVARHAQARNCHIRLGVANGLCVEVSDDGKGLSAAHRAGVGHGSMRERAAELGGEFGIENIATGGMKVWVRLPLPAEEV